MLPLIESEEPLAYDVSLSFAGEQRDYVESVAAGLRERGVRVFYDKFEPAELWGKDLVEHLLWVYRDAARYCVLFVSKEYAAKAWPTHERRSALERALADGVNEYLLPARFDDTEVPGLRNTIGYVDLTEIEPDELVELIRKKLGPRPRKNYLPPIPDRLFDALGAEDEESRERIYSHAWQFLDALRKTTLDERLLINALLMDGCHAELPENVHMSMNILRRETEFTKPKVRRLLERISPLGFEIRLREGHPEEADVIHDLEKFVVMEWHDLTPRYGENATDVVRTMLRVAIDGYCDGCAEYALRNLDFSQLSSATAEDDVHLSESA